MLQEIEEKRAHLMDALLEADKALIVYHAKINAARQCAEELSTLIQTFTSLPHITIGDFEMDN